MSDVADLDLDALHDLARAGHSERRARERYDADLTDADRADMVAQIGEARGQHLATLLGGHTAWLVYWPSARRIVPVVYAKRHRAILTVLARDCYDVRRVKQELDAAVKQAIGTEIEACAAIVARFSEDEDDGFLRAAALIRNRIPTINPAPDRAGETKPNTAA